MRILTYTFAPSKDNSLSLSARLTNGELGFDNAQVNAIRAELQLRWDRFVASLGRWTDSGDLISELTANYYWPHPHLVGVEIMLGVRLWLPHHALDFHEHMEAFVNGCGIWIVNSIPGVSERAAKGT
jgi:hypothetical protein